MQKILGVEIIPEVVQNARKMQKKWNSKCQFFLLVPGTYFARSTENFLPDVIVTDPPRNGLPKVRKSLFSRIREEDDFFEF